ncbi:MAG: hypothetical protein QM757_26450 [Paludibaculum sp.]
MRNFNPNFEDDMPAPAPLDETVAEEREEKKPSSGEPPAYRSEEVHCEGCEYFREFSNPSCTKFKYQAEPGGSCEAFESRKEDSYGTKEDSYANMEGDEDASDEI